MPDQIQIMVLEGPLSRGTADTLAQVGWSVLHVASISQLLSEVERAALVVLDVLAPGINMQVYQELKQRFQAPVLAIMPTLDIGDEVAALRAPFDEGTLLRRAQDLLAGAQPDLVQVGELTIDLNARWVTLSGHPIDLSAIQFDLLAYLARRMGQAVEYDELLEAVWGYPAGCGTRDAVKSCVKRLRWKLGEDATHPEYLVNVRGVGYRLRHRKSGKRWSGRVNDNDQQTRQRL